MKKKIYSITLIISLFVSFIHAQENYLSEIKIENQAASKQDGLLHLSMDVNLSDLHVNTQHMITLTPVLTSADGANRIALAPIIVNGTTRDKVLTRSRKLNNTPVFDMEPTAIIRRKNGTAQTFHYQTALPLQDWMRKATLAIEQQVHGCAQCELADNQLLLMDGLLPEPFVPSYKLTYIVPEVEPVKMRCEECVARFNYKVARHELLRDFADNNKEFELVDETIRTVQSDKNITITDLMVSGYASPEGNANSNMALSQRRANALAEYITNKYGIARKDIDVKWYGEDWKGLEEVVMESNISDKNEILDIIRNTSDLDARDVKLKKLSRGETYRTLLSVYYPPLRRNEYRINYEVRGFNAEEAREIIKTKPQQLSLNEMYMVAESHPPASKEFKEVFDIAARMYPDDPIAIMNAATADIEAGNMQAAINRLSKIENDARAWNNIGVAYARMGDTQKAGEYFAKAAAKGDADAKNNAEQLQKYLGDK